MSAGARAIAGAARTKPHTGRAFLLTVSVVAAVGGFLFGFDTGVVSGALLYVGDDFGSLSSFQQDAVVSGTLLGAAIGAIFGGRAADRFGRRQTLLGVALSFIVGIVTAYFVDYAFASSGEWRWMFGVGLIPAVILGVAMLYMPETPRPSNGSRCSSW